MTPDRIPSALPAGLRDYHARGGALWLFNGLLQIRGLDPEPPWNHLFRYWTGEKAFHRAYQSLTPSDVPFAQDGFGDQFILREGKVGKLLCETGDFEATDLSFQDWLAQVHAHPTETLNINLDLQLTPGKLFHAFPPFCMAESSQASFREISLDEVLDFHAYLASQIRGLQDGQQIEIRLEPPPG